MAIIVYYAQTHSKFCWRLSNVHRFSMFTMIIKCIDHECIACFQHCNCHVYTVVPLLAFIVYWNFQINQTKSEIQQTNI